MTSKEKIYGKIIADKVFFIKILDDLKIDKHYTGYYMLIEILDVIINQEPNMVPSFSKDIYPHVALKFNKKVCTIERNIRNLIDKCWDVEMMHKLKIFLIDGDKPKCRDFVFTVKNYIITQLG